jgi:hypothetical protein
LVVEKRFTELLGCDKKMSILMDEGQGFWEWYHIEPKKVGPGLVGLPCRELCGFDLKRVHLTCLHCRARRVALGLLPPLFPVYLHFWTVRVRGRRFALLKDRLIKWLASVIELLAD